MRGYNKWSYAPYKPLLTEVGDIYICRIAPYENYIHLEWLESCGECRIFYKKRDAEDFVLSGKTAKNQFDITGLEAETDYEFYITADQKKSRTRLARTYTPIGTTVGYLAIITLNILTLRRCTEDPPAVLRQALRPLLAALAMGVAVFAAYWALCMVTSSHLVLCGGPILVGVAVYAVMAIVCKALTREDCLLLPKGEKIAKLLHL